MSKILEVGTPRAGGVMSAYDQASIVINRCKRILALVDIYVERQTAATRTDLRRALLDEFEAPTTATPVAEGSVDTRAEMRALCSACGGTGDVHSLDGEWRGQCTCVHAWQQRAEKAEARTKELEAQLARRGAPLSPETRQAIAAARAAGQSIAATSGGLIFMNDGTERDCSTLDCPACGGSGHAADAAARSAP